MKVSIITPSFNQGHFIRETIDSVLSQGEALGDYVIVDGGSTDSTIGILADYRLNPGVKAVISEPDRGQADALNKGVRLVGDDILGYLNSDDILVSGALKFVSDYFIDHPEIDVICGTRLVIGPRSRIIYRAPAILGEGADFYRSMNFFQEATFWRRSAFDRAGGSFDSSYRFAMDFELFTRMKMNGARFAVVPRLLGMFRVHDSSKTSTVFWDVGMTELRKLWRRHDLVDISNRQYLCWNERELRSKLGARYWKVRAGKMITTRLLNFF